MIRAVDLIRKKREGGALEPHEIQWLIRNYTDGSVGDDQMAAFCMAVFFRGMGGGELTALVQAMMDSGQIVDLQEIPGRKVDKHSTGGVGDKISLCLAPLVAACGVPVPMMSGRGLGHTGGTLDKLAAIPGFRTDATEAEFKQWLTRNHLAFIGQTAQLVPADRRLYALRDITGTVESIPLIAASIMSKKLAEGIDALVLDVKVGSGAFMKDLERAQSLAKTMMSIGEKMGRNVRAVVSDMNQVLGIACGNANETWEAIEVLQGGGPADVIELTVELGATMLVQGGIADSEEDGRTRIIRAICDGRGLEKLRKVIETQGGDPRVVDAREKMPTAQFRHDVLATQAGVLVGTDVEAVGRAAMLLGAGRARQSDPIDYGVGLRVHVRLGQAIAVNDPLVTVEYNDETRLQAALPVLTSAFRFDSEAKNAIPPLIHVRLPAR